MSNVNQEAKDSSVPRDELPERIWIDRPRLDSTRFLYSCYAPNGLSVKIVEYVRADLVAPQSDFRTAYASLSDDVRSLVDRLYLPGYTSASAGKTHAEMIRWLQRAIDELKDLRVKDQATWEDPTTSGGAGDDEGFLCDRCGEWVDRPRRTEIDTCTPCRKAIRDEDKILATESAEMAPPRAVASSIYVASRASVPERGQMWRDFRTNGFDITSSWIDEDGAGQTSDWEELWERIASEISDSNVLVLYAERDDFPLKGAFIEVGIAIGMGIPVIVCLPGVVLDQNWRPIGSWINHPLVSHVDDINAAMKLARLTNTAKPVDSVVAVESGLPPESDAIGLRLFRQIVSGQNALRELDVVRCNERSHDLDCKCFWEQCEAWAIADATIGEQSVPLHEHKFQLWTGTPDALCWCGAVIKADSTSVPSGQREVFDAGMDLGCSLLEFDQIKVRSPEEGSPEVGAWHDNYVRKQDALIRAVKFVLANPRSLSPDSPTEQSGYGKGVADAVGIANVVENENDLNDGGFFEAGFLAAKTKILDALIDAREAAPASTGQHEVGDAEAIAKKLANEIAGHYCSAGPDHSSMRVTVFNIAHRIIRDATSTSIGHDQRTIEACAQIAERHSCTHASGYRCYEGDKIAKTIRALAITPVHEGENCERA